jgi:hypothetical protein
VFNGTITQGSTVIASFNMDPDGQPAITRDGIVSTDSLAVIQIGADAKTFTVIYVFVADDAIAPPAFLVGNTYALRNKQGRFIKLNLDIVHGIHEAIDAAQQPQGNPLAPIPHDGPGQGLAQQLAGHLAQSPTARAEFPVFLNLSWLFDNAARFNATHTNDTSAILGPLSS